MNKQILPLAMIIILSGFVVAQTIPANFSLNHLQNLKSSSLNGLFCQLVSLYSNKIVGQEIPKNLPYKNEIFNLYISNESLGSVVVINGKINSISCDNNKNWTYDIYIKNSSVLSDFSNGFDAKILSNDINNGSIRIKSSNFGKAIKLFFSKLFLKWFM